MFSGHGQKPFGSGMGQVPIEESLAQGDDIADGNVADGDVADNDTVDGDIADNDTADDDTVDGDDAALLQEGDTSGDSDDSGTAESTVFSVANSSSHSHTGLIVTVIIVVVAVVIGLYATPQGRFVRGYIGREYELHKAEHDHRQGRSGEQDTQSADDSSDDIAEKLKSELDKVDSAAGDVYGIDAQRVGNKEIKALNTALDAVGHDNQVYAKSDAVKSGKAAEKFALYLQAFGKYKAFLEDYERYAPTISKILQACNDIKSPSSHKEATAYIKKVNAITTDLDKIADSQNDSVKTLNATLRTMTDAGLNAAKEVESKGDDIYVNQAHAERLSQAMDFYGETEDAKQQFKQNLDAEQSAFHVKWALSRVSAAITYDRIPTDYKANQDDSDLMKAYYNVHIAYVRLANQISSMAGALGQIEESDVNDLRDEETALSHANAAIEPLATAQKGKIKEDYAQYQKAYKRYTALAEPYTRNAMAISEAYTACTVDPGLPMSQGNYDAYDNFIASCRNALQPMQSESDANVSKLVKSVGALMDSRAKIIDGLKKLPDDSKETEAQRKQRDKANQKLENVKNASFAFSAYTDQWSKEAQKIDMPTILLDAEDSAGDVVENDGR